jgi:PAS domain S-box-containing protein
MVDVRKIFDSVAEIWILVDQTGKVLMTSKHLEKFRRLIHPPLVVGASIFESIPPSWLQLSENILATLLESPAPYTLEASYDHPDGKVTHFEIKCTAIHSENGEVQHIFIEARDVTPQKIFENKITIVAREYQSVIENANAVIIGTDTRGYITEWNEMARVVTGYSKNEAFLRRFVDFLSTESRERYVYATEKVLSGDVKTRGGEGSLCVDGFA